MLTKLNLASYPFRNRTLPWTVTAVLTCLSLVALVLIFAENRRANAEADVVERDLQRLKREHDALQAQATEVRQSVPPDQLKVLEAAHELVSRKNFSWSRLFADLEAALPTSVRVGRIGVRGVTQRGGRTSADLDLSVTGRTPAEVSTMIEEWNRNGVFIATPVSESPKNDRNQSGIEWTLRVTYTPRPGAPARGNNADVASANTPQRTEATAR